MNTAHATTTAAAPMPDLEAFFRDSDEGALGGDVMMALARSSARGTAMRLQPRIDPALRDKVAPHLEAQGATFIAQVDAFIFREEAEPILEAMLLTGRARRAIGAIDVSVEAIEAICGAALLDPRMRVLVPGGGDGALARAAAARSLDYGTVTTEADPASVRVLKDMDLGPVIAKPFLHIEPSDLVAFERIVAIPSFLGHDAAIQVTHAMRFLAPGGRLVAALPRVVTYRDDAISRDFRRLVADHEWTLAPLPKGSFSADGQDIPAVALTVDLAGLSPEG